MQCHKCGYSLWNIASRQCPECGESFKPSDYHFKPGSVVYCCPECRRDYHSIDSDGNLSPREQYCACGHYMQMDQMILKPATGQENQHCYINRNPWVTREVGSLSSLIRAWWQTTRMSIICPESLCVHSDSTDPMGHGWGYFVLHVFVSVFLSFCLLAELGLFAGFGEGFFDLSMLLPLAGYQAAIAFTAIFLGSVGSVMVGIPLHLILRMFGTKSCRVDQTLESIMFSSGILCFWMLPVIGVFFSPLLIFIWSVNASKMLARFHGMSARLAWVFTVFAITILAMVLLISMGGLFILASMALAGA